MITPAFEAVWPDVQRRLRALLHRRGLDSASTDDIVQEVALRALANHVTYASSKDLLRWAVPVACNLHVDLLRHRARVLDDPGATERPASVDVVREVTHRIELQRAFRGIAALRPADRAALIDAVAEEPVVPRTRQEAVRLAVRRHRARSRLIVVLSQISAWVGGVLALPRLRRSTAAVALVPAAAASFLVIGAPHHGGAALRPVTPQFRTSQVARTVPAPALGHAATRPERALPVARPVHHRAAVPPRAPGLNRKQIVGIDGPGVSPAAGTEDHPPGNHMACVENLPVVDDVCV